VASQLLGSFMESNSFQCLRLDLADSLTGDAEFSAHFFERVADAIVES
jgi:hypothetical protein